MKPSFFLLRVLASAVLLLSAASGDITGKVTNATTGKPAAGDDVVLLRLSQGMDEIARTKTDARGQFTLKVSDAGAPHLVRVSHGGVNYHKAAPPGTTTADVEVYDAAPKLDGISATVNVVRFSATGDQLQVIELFALKNDSSPPKTLMSDKTFELDLPEGAVVDSSMAAGPGGMPVTSSPVPDEGKKGRYYYVFPLRPGETRFQLSYHLPYNGKASFAPTALYNMEHFVVMLPKSMEFRPADRQQFSPMQEDASANTQVATAVKAGDKLAFSISGSGEFPREQQGGGEEPAGATSNDARPGGGLGPPSEQPDPLKQYRWYILGALALALAAGAVYVLRRGPASAPAPSSTPATAVQGRGVARTATPASANGNARSAAIMD